MAYDNRNQSRVDRFGNEFKLCRAFINDAGFHKGHVEIGGKLYAIEFGSQSQDDDKRGAFVWVRVTQKKKRAQGRGF